MRDRRESIIRQLTQCISRHIADSKRDGLRNSLGHLEQIDEDARTILMVLNEAPYEIPLHNL